MKKHVSIGLAVVTGSLLNLPSALADSAVTAQCVAVDSATIEGLFTRWNESLATLDPDKVAANYWEDGVLLPTVSNDMRTSRPEIKDYFTKFLTMKPQGTIDERVIKLGCNSALDAGIYTFSLEKDGKPAKVQARYTFTYEYRDGSWKISSHHSSAMPEATAPAVAGQ